MGMSTAICILGPTASGKSRLAESLAGSMPAEIVNVDSAQVYRGLDIGSAKADSATRQAIQHHLIDIRDPFSSYSASEFVTDAEQVIKEILARKKIPILVGGTMLYFKALFEGLANMPEADAGVRAVLMQEVQEKGLLALHEELRRLDPKAAGRIKPTDPQRIVRALEVYRLTGKNISYWHEQQQLARKNRKSQIRYIKLALVPEDRQHLHRRIEARLQHMLQQGFVSEVQGLSERPDFARQSPAMRSVGYRQLLAHILDGEDLNESFMKAVFASRQLAKRQLTWLRKFPQLVCFDPFDLDLTDKIEAYLVSVDIEFSSSI